jgi:hypothetical protein
VKILASLGAEKSSRFKPRHQESVVFETAKRCAVVVVWTVLEMALKQDIEEITARIDFCESSLSQLRKDLLIYLSKRSGGLSILYYH